VTEVAGRSAWKSAKCSHQTANHVLQEGDDVFCDVAFVETIASRHDADTAAGGGAPTSTIFAWSRQIGQRWCHWLYAEPSGFSQLLVRRPLVDELAVAVIVAVVLGRRKAIARISIARRDTCANVIVPTSSTASAAYAHQAPRRIDPRAGRSFAM
jgi:hypothetical protein